MSRTALLILLMSVTLVAGAEQAPPPRVIPIEEWVAQLGTGPLAQREEAEKKLSSLTIEPPTEVLAALKSPSLDARERAARIIQSMRWNVGATRLGRGQRFAEQGKVDLFVAATAVWDLRPDDDRLWAPAVDLGRLLIDDKAGIKGDFRPHNTPSSYRDYATYKQNSPPKFKRMDEPYIHPDPASANPPIHCFQEAIQAPSVVTAKGFVGNLVVSRGIVEAETNYQASLVLANGDVTALGGIASSIIVCDGDVVVTRSISKSLVVARGNITIKGFTTTSKLIAGGKITVEVQTKTSKVYHSSIKEKEPNPLGFITFFEPSTVGLDVKVVEGTVNVAKVAAKSECEKAGLKVGDVILEAAGKKPTDAESLRRLLRDALAIGDASVKLNRGNDTLSVKVALPE